MSLVSPSTAVLDIIRSANDRVVIVAPYIKSKALQIVLGALQSTVSELVCVTRWLPEDIACGVCDIEILEDVWAKGGQLFVYPHLHAKYYRAGRRCLVGSANLTGRGLGWKTPANLELLVELSIDFPGLAEWEDALLVSAIPATVELRDQIRREAENLEATAGKLISPEVDGGTEHDGAASDWIPSCPVPDRLWDVYKGGGADTIVSSARQAAQRDLTALAPPNGLSEKLFGAYIVGILKQMPLMVEIDRLASTGLPDTEALTLVSDKLGAGDLALSNERWRVLKAWLLYFFPETYRLETGHEVLVKGERLLR